MAVFNDLTHIEFLSKQLDAFGGDKGRVAFAAARKAADDALASRIALGGDVEQINADDRLTPVGRAEKIEKSIESHYTNLHAQRWALAKAAIQVEAKAPQLPALEPADAAGAALDSEIRAHVRQLPAADRERLLSDKGDVRLQVALARGPAALSGLSEATHHALSERLIEAGRPGELQHTKNDREAIRLAGDAVSSALDYAQKTLGYRGKQLAEFEARVLRPLELRIAEKEQKVSPTDWAAARAGNFEPMIQTAREEAKRLRAAGLLWA